MSGSGAGALPDGVVLHELVTHADARGAFTEIFRQEWDVAVSPVQWNAVASEAGVLRGVHVHERHADYLTVALGRLVLGLRDLRPTSATAAMACAVELSAAGMAAVEIPPGVAHGFYYPVPSLHLRRLALLGSRRRARLSLGRSGAAHPLARGSGTRLPA